MPPAQPVPPWNPRFLREALRLHGLTDEQLAARLGVTPARLRRWERGDTAPAPRFQAKLHALLRAR